MLRPSHLNLSRLLCVSGPNQRLSGLGVKYLDNSRRRPYSIPEAQWPVARFLRLALGSTLAICSCN